MTPEHKAWVAYDQPSEEYVLNQNGVIVRSSQHDRLWPGLQDGIDDSYNIYNANDRRLFEQFGWINGRLIMSADAEVAKFDVQTAAVRGLNPIADDKASWHKKIIIKT